MGVLELSMDLSSIYKSKACSYGSITKHCINSVLRLVLSMNIAYDLRTENRRHFSYIHGTGHTHGKKLHLFFFHQEQGVILLVCSNFITVEF